MKGWFYVLQVTPNLYGNLVANVAAGIAGGTGVMPGGISLLPFITSSLFYKVYILPWDLTRDS